jgi:hypothetical protein
VSRRLLCTLALLLVAAGSELDAVPEVPSAHEIMERAHTNWSRYDTSATLSLEIVARSGRRMERRLEALRLRVNGQSRTLIRMLHPVDLRGTTLLVLENRERDDDRFLYLPVSRRVRRIAAGQRSDRVLGTDFSYEDLGAGDLDDYRHERLEDETQNGVRCYVIRTVEAESDASGYRRTSWISRDRFVPIRVDYERHGRLSRRLRSDPASITALGPDPWLPRRVVMRDLIRGTQTRLSVRSLDVEPRIDPDQLTLVHLESLSRRQLLREHADEETPSPHSENGSD